MWMEEQLVMGGVCSCKFPAGTVCMSVHCRELSSALYARVWNEKVNYCTVALVDGIKDKNSVRRVRIPITDGSHYGVAFICLLYTSPSPRDLSTSRMPSSA